MRAAGDVVGDPGRRERAARAPARARRPRPSPASAGRAGQQPERPPVACRAPAPPRCARRSPSRARRAAIHSAASRSPSDADGRSMAAGARRPAAQRAATSVAHGRGLARHGPTRYPVGSLPRHGPDPDCLFCKIVAGEIPATKVDEDERTVAFMDINPATRGHVARHPARARARPARDRRRGPRGRRAAPPSAMAGRHVERLGADGVNLLNSCGAAAWQTVFHFHVHVIPRYDGRPAAAALDPGAGRPGRDRRGRRRSCTRDERRVRSRVRARRRRSRSSRSTRRR